MAVLKLRNIPASINLMTQWYLVKWPWKNSNVGKTSEREGVLLISSISGNYISAKIKPTEFTYLFPRFSCLKFTGRNPTSATSNSVHRQSYRTDCHSIKCCTDFLKTCPEFSCCCTTAVRPLAILDTFSNKNVQHLMLWQSVRYDCLCTDFDVTVFGFLPVNFKHENRGKR